MTSVPKFSRSFAAAVASFGLVQVSTPVYAAEATRHPNILVIVADDLGYADVGFHGGKEIPTPNLDQLAAAGTRFSSGYVSCPVCSPTRAGLVTGRYQQRFGHEFNPGPAAMNAAKGLPLDERTIADALRSAGYKTGLVGKWHLGNTPELHPNERGFDEFFGFLGGAHRYLGVARGANVQPILRDREPVEEQQYLTDAFGREAVAFIERNSGQPFYLQVTFNAVHTPLEATSKYLERFAKIEDERHRQYAAMLSALDDNVGEILAALHQRQLDENTLVFFISDNGGPPQANTSSNAPLRGSKGTVWEGGIRVPFVLRWTGTVPAGKVYESPVISLDIFATALAAAHAASLTEKPIDGVNLLPYVTGESKTPPHDSLYWRFGQQWAIRQGDYKLVKVGGERPQLFNLANDIGEQNDLASSQGEIVSQLQQTYQAWNSELVAPLWQREPANRQQQRRAQRRAAAVN